MGCENVFNGSGAVWIWPCGCKKTNQYVQFRQEFVISKQSSSQAMLYISTDTAYSVWLNDRFVHSGQFHDWPGHKTFDSLDISNWVRPGKNSICILAYYQGANSAQYVCNDPGLIYVIQTGQERIVSGVQTCFRASPGYKVENMERITPQLHFAFEFDSRKEDEWISSHYTQNESWKAVTSDDISGVDISNLCPRNVERVVIKERIPAKIIAQGIFKRDGEPSDRTIAGIMYNDFLSARLPNAIFENGRPEFGQQPIIIKSVAGTDEHTGIYLIIDLGAEQVGLFELDIDVNAGTRVDIAYGEHLDDLRVRSVIGSRNFANRYIAKQGRQTFTHYFTRFAGRYVELHISNIQGIGKLYYAGLRSVEYPFNIMGKFESDCALQNKIYNTSVRTLQLCAHEHYEDCPWREQALYANDARNQALSGYYCFGEYKMPAASFELLGGGLKPDGFLELCAPAQLPITIPSFSMAWVLAIKDYFMYSGDIQRTQGLYNTARCMIKAWLDALKDGLLPCPTGSRYWHFYDWASGLDGTVQNDCTRFEEISDVRYDAPLNLLFCLALESASVLAKYCGNPEDVKAFQSHADALKTKIHKTFFNVESGFYVTYIGDDKRKNHYAQLTQSLAVLAKVCPDGIADSIRTELIRKDSDLVETTLSQSLYKFEALLSDKERFGRYVFKKIEDDWGQMLFEGATSFWETLKGGWDFDRAGSLCHGWSAIPVYIYHAHLLGIRPVEPGFKKFACDPSVCAINTHEAHIPTPSGIIKVQLQRIGDHVIGELEHPRQLNPVFLPATLEAEIKVCSY